MFHDVSGSGSVVSPRHGDRWIVDMNETEPKERKSHRAQREAERPLEHCGFSWLFSNEKDHVLDMKYYIQDHTSSMFLTIHITSYYIIIEQLD